MQIPKDEILLLKLIKEGDQFAFKHLFYLYADQMERFIVYYIHDKEKAQDLVLDIFTYIWEHRDSFEIKLTFKAYLFQAAKNKAFTYIRDKKTTLFLNDLPAQEIGEEEIHKMEIDELSHLIEEAVTLLPERCREIFLKSRQENMTNKEIANELKLSEKTVEAQITIALKRIRTFLGDAYSYLW
ncbi:MAG: RNA polymerase sigma-70 factor [Tannerellaceae bacterium]|jgi:RNA polymerase sigma-70 factor (ECF subfamily)|nr:RNA polymerase sigma-70 factor [Tannerellaceae bacterium]